MGSPASAFSVDDSTTGAGYGTTGVGTPIRPGVTELTGTPTGPATHFASNKATIWTDSGFYVTDVFDSSLTDLSGLSVGDELFAGTGGSTGNLIDSGTDVLGRFVRRFEALAAGATVDDFDSFFLPRVQPKLAGEVFMVLKFK